MTLLSDIKEIIESPATLSRDHFEIQDLADAVKAFIAAEQVHIEYKRWGDIMGTVLGRRLPSDSYVARVPKFEYVMVTEYVYDEGADGGDLELDAYTVDKKLVSQTVWV